MASVTPLLSKTSPLEMKLSFELLCDQPGGRVTINGWLVKDRTLYVPGDIDPAGRIGRDALGAGDVEGDGATVGGGEARPGPPVPPLPGRKLIPATATATTAAAAKASFGAVFIRWTLRAGHQDRRCGVAG